MADHFENLAKDIQQQIQTSRQTPHRINPREFTLNRIIIKLLKTTIKEKKPWKYQKRIDSMPIKEKKNCMTGFIIRNHGGQKKVAN